MKALSIQVFILLAFVTAGCDQLETAPLSGVVHTDEQGMILEDDPGDWQPRCGGTNGFCITPLSPNPAEVDRQSSLTFTLSEAAFVSIRVENEQGRALDEIKGKRLEAGESTLAIVPQTSRGYKEGIYRIFISAYDAKGRLLFKTYGDFGVEGPHNNAFQRTPGGATFSVTGASE